MYKKTKERDESIIENVIQRKLDGAFIPFDLKNTDYQEYLEWVADGNTPEAAD